MHTEGWEEIVQYTKISYKFVLQPSKETIKIRDTERDEKYFMGEEAIEEHLDYLSQDNFKDFTIVDSTNQTVDQTVDIIISMLTEN